MSYALLGEDLKKYLQKAAKYNSSIKRNQEILDDEREILDSLDVKDEYYQEDKKRSLYTIGIYEENIKELKKLRLDLILDAVRRIFDKMYQSYNITSVTDEIIEVTYYDILGQYTAIFPIAPYKGLIRDPEHSFDKYVRLTISELVYITQEKLFHILKPFDIDEFKSKVYQEQDVSKRDIMSVKEVYNEETRLRLQGLDISVSLDYERMYHYGTRSIDIENVYIIILNDHISPNSIPLGQSSHHLRTVIIVSQDNLDIIGSILPDYLYSLLNNLFALMRIPKKIESDPYVSGKLNEALGATEISRDVQNIIRQYGNFSDRDWKAL